MKQLLLRAFGRTTERISMVGLGGSHIGKSELSEKEAIGIMRAALDNGLTFFDNSWDYNKGRSEKLMGKALRDGYRQKAFVMTKIDGRTKESAAKQLDESLRRLSVDQIDLVQHHEVIRFDDADRIFAKGGANEALEAAKKQGKLRYIGFTGHKDPAVHLHMLMAAEARDFEFDSVQMPLNAMDAHYRSFEKQVLPEALRKGIAVLGMKSLGGGVLLKSRLVSAEECLRYALSLPVATVITGIDSMKRLNMVLKVAQNFTPMGADERGDLLERTRKAAETGDFELFKTTSWFDATAEHPEWLGGHSARTKALGK